MCFKQKDDPTLGSPQITHRPSRFIRNWYMRCGETGKPVNSFLIILGISALG